MGTPLSSRVNISSCRTCHSPRLKLYLPLGDHAPANSFLSPEQLALPEQRYPLEVFYCEDCFHSQLGYTVPPELMFRNYLWVSSTSDQIPVHFAEYAKEVYERFMKPGDLVVEVASNDGCLLKTFKQFDVRFLGVEPARNIAALAEKQGVPTVAEFFTAALAYRLVKEHGHATVLISNNVFAHVDTMDDFVAAGYTLLSDTGVWTIESPHILEFLKKNEFDTVYHEHISYLSLYALIPFFKRHQLNLYDVKRTTVHGGSIRMIVSKDMSIPATESLTALLNEEITAGINVPATYEAFGKSVQELREDTMVLLHTLKTEGKTIVGYGASAKGQTLLQYFGIGPDVLDYILDKAPLKQGRYTPGTHIPIVPPDHWKQQRPDYMFILAWNFAEEIMRQQHEFAAQGGKFIVPIPTPAIV